MKALSILSLAFLADAAALAGPALVARQFGGDLLGFGNRGPPLNPIRIRKLESTFKDAVREELLWGPFAVQPSNASHKSTAFKLDAGSDVLTSRVQGLCSNCMVLKARGDIAGKDGSKADIGSAGVYSHHFLMTDMGRASAAMPVTAGLCPNGKMGGFNFEALLPSKNMAHGHSGSMKKRQFKLPEGINLASVMQFLPKFSVFLGQGDEGSAQVFADPTYKIKSGFWLGGGDDMSAVAEVINYDPVAKDIYFLLDYEYLPNLPSRPADYLDVGMGAINVDPCGSAALFPPADRAQKYVSPPWTVTQDGYILDVKPHLHDGGVNMTFAVNGNVACTSKAVYGGETGTTKVGGEKWETITAYEPCLDPIAIKKGDKVTMEAWYDLTQHKLRPMNEDGGADGEGMAMALFVAAVKKA